ncbi:MAG: hypothetical protein OQK82_06785 [Candidatus Pacearchaeota archaeon]|nr:hypothetical protein [Candidatus Pacearchaeota archaeon]
MINIMIKNDAFKKLKKLSEKEEKKISDALRKIQENKLSGIKKIPSSDLFAKKISNHVLIMTKKENDFYIIDIMTKSKFDLEYKKSIRLLF